MKRGENIRKRKDGRWEGRYPGKDGKTHSVYGRSYREAKEKLNGCRMESKSAQPEKRMAGISFQSLCQAWLEVKSLKLKPSSYAAYYTIVYNHLIPFWQNKSIYQIDFPREAKQLVQTKKMQNLSSRRVQEILSRLKQILKFASKHYALPVIELDLEILPYCQKEVQVLCEEEQQKITESLMIRQDRRKLGVFLSLYLGLRIGEVCALKWGDIDFDAQTLQINKTMQRVKNLNPNEPCKTKIIIGTPKSIKSRRCLPLPFFLFTMLKTYQGRPDAFLLTGTNRFVEPRQYENIFKTYLQELSIRPVNYHALRHTFATRAVEKGIDIKTLSELLGHSSVSITLQLYVHPSIQEKARSIEKIAG